MDIEEVKRGPDSLAEESDKVYQKFRLAYKDILSIKAGWPVLQLQPVQEFLYFLEKVQNLSVSQL